MSQYVNMLVLAGQEVIWGNVLQCKNVEVAQDERRGN